MEAKELNEFANVYGRQDLFICPHSVYGCRFKGPYNTLLAHLQNCPFNIMKVYLTEQAMEIQDLRQQLQQMQLAITATMPQNKVPFFSLVAHSAAVVSLAMSGDALFSGSMDGTLKETLISTKKTVREISLGPVFQLMIADGVMYSGHSGCVRVFNSNLQLVRDLTGHNGNVKALQVFGPYLFAGSEKEIKVWNTTTFQCLGTLPGAHDGDVRDFVVLLDARGQLASFLSCGDDGFIKMWDQAFQRILVMPAHRAPIRAMVHLDIPGAGTFVLTGSDDTYIKIWEVHPRELNLVARVPCLVGVTSLRTVTLQEDSLKDGTPVRVTFQGLISGHKDGSIRVWSMKNLRSLTSLCLLRQHTDSVRALAVAPPYFISGSYDHTITVWSPEFFHIVS